MTFIRSSVPIVTLCLLLFAAADLFASETCDDGLAVVAGAAAVDDLPAPDAPGHQGDDCYCCSRTVRTEMVVSFAHVCGPELAADVRPPSLLHQPAAPPYHPPQA